VSRLRPAARALSVLALLLLAALPGRAQRLFWESPQVLVPSGARFPAAAAGGGLMVVVWQEFVQNAGGQREVWLTASVSRDARQWSTASRFAGPFPAQERETPIFSLAVNERGHIFVAAASADRRTAIYGSRDGGRSFANLASVEAFATSVAPSLFITSRGQLLLFATQESQSFLTQQYALSADGVEWSTFQPLVRDPQFPINFLAYHAAFRGRDYVVCQTLRRGERRFQLLLFSSADGGRSWSDARPLEFDETVDGRVQGPALFSNQRPFLAALPDRLGLVWERQYQSRPVRVYYLELDGSGGLLGQAQPVTEGAVAAFFPRLVRFRDRSYVFYFSGANKVFAAEATAAGWTSRELNELTGSSYFAYPVELAGRLYVFWENRVQDSSRQEISRLIMLQPDQSVEPPRLAAVNFTPGEASRQELVQVRWAPPPDSSGVSGFNYVWSQDPEAKVPGGEPGLLADARNASVKADHDGTWYFRVAAQDYAGNWSRPATIAYTRDTTPPGKPRLILPPQDPDGYLTANSFELDWQPADPSDAAGYAVNLEYLGSAAAAMAAPPLPATANTRLTRTRYENLDDGVWAFAVAAVDAAGNRGEPAVALLHLNKYVPVTYISYVNEQRQPSGVVDLTIGGRGFELGGQVGTVLLDRDGAAPYDYSFSRASGAFRIVSDRLIRGLTLPNVQEGVYRVGVIHPTRGVAWSGKALRLERPGTVKFGDFEPSNMYSSPWQRVRLLTGSLGTNTLLAWLAVLFLTVLSLASLRRLASLAQEGRILRREVMAVLRGEIPPARKVVRMAELKRAGLGLRWKYTALVMILVLLVVLMVSIPISIYMGNAQRRTMTQGLVQRVDTLLASLSSSAENNMTQDGVRQLAILRDQVASTMSEAQYVTMTGIGLDDKARFDYIWATSDPDIAAKTEGKRFIAEDYGRVRLNDEISAPLDKLAAEVNQAARAQVAGLAEDVDRLGAEARDLALKTDARSQARIRQLDVEIKDLGAKLAVELQGIRGHARSFPPLDPRHPPRNLASSYLFYLPVVYRQRGEDVYFRGAVRLAVSTRDIRAELSGSQRRLIFQTGIIALVVLGLGLIGAIIMANITVGPIKKLAAGVAKIRDTEDKEDLKDEPPIDVGTRDEIGSLAATVNEMRDGLVKAAKAQKEMMVGKDIQRMFLPLAKVAGDKKGATAGEQDEQLEIFGYYEGAREVSGDFFDYKKLADSYYAMIKCDVSGKGVSAALIMVEVATIFSTYFRGWTPQRPGLKLEPLADLINDMLVEREFKGRFAALTLAILNAQDGKVWLCNAGDNIQHIYRRAQGRMTSLQLPNPPATGVFPTDLVEMKGGFKQVPEQLAPGDVLFLFTDGFEDGLGEVAARQKGKEAEAERGPKEESPGMPRIYAVIDAVLNRRPFRLSGHLNALLEPELDFDFTTCSGSVEEAVLALVAVEKVLRLQPAADAGEKDRVNVDRRVDAFLSKHYGQYARCCSRRLEARQDEEQVTFTHLREEAQYDDLTILAVRKK
jgi:HAMP domain-containing protein